MEIIPLHLLYKKKLKLYLGKMFGMNIVNKKM